MSTSQPKKIDHEGIRIDLVEFERLARAIAERANALSGVPNFYTLEDIRLNSRFLDFLDDGPLGITIIASLVNPIDHQIEIYVDIQCAEGEDNVVIALSALLKGVEDLETLGTFDKESFKKRILENSSSAPVKIEPFTSVQSLAQKNKKMLN